MAKVMLVDDDQSMMSLLKTLLELDGHSVITHANPVTVLEKLAVEKPQVVIMDIKLKGGDGLSLLRAIRQTQDKVQMPVIMASGLDAKEECLLAGANDFVLKPYSPPVLMEMVAKVVSPQEQTQET